jgi:VWFA-related protein
MSRWIAALIAVCLAVPCMAGTKILVTVVEKNSGRPVTDVKAEDFTVLDDRKERRVDSAEYSTGPMDVMLLMDSGLLGGAVQPVADNLITPLRPQEQMAIVAYHSSADLIQDFTSSKDLLRRALASVRFGNAPRALDALYAAIDGGFQASTFRRVVILLTTGMEGPSRMTEREVFHVARRNGVSIYPVYAAGQERSLFESLARQTGGATFSLRDLQKESKEPPGPRIFEVMRGHYTLTLQGNLSLGNRIEVKVKRPEKLLVSGLPLD